MKATLSRRFWIEAGLAFLSTGLTVLSLVSRDWIEALFKVEPDGGSGLLEWVIVGTALAATIVFTALTRLEWRKCAAVTG